jgi:hypothetical protein
MGNPPSSAPRTLKLRHAQLLADQAQPWRSRLPDLRAINPIPSMICEDESRFLHWIARNHLSGAGHIVDVGPLAGGSTHALCSGLALNPRAAGRTKVHSYDLWRFFSGWERFFPGVTPKVGDDIYPLFRKNLQAFKDVVVAHPGDLRKHRWDGGLIEILFIDSAKSLDLWTHVLREFLPHCIPGRTLIVQQDWVCAECPWIHLTTARLSEYLVAVDSPHGATVAFLLKRVIPRAVLKADDFLTQPVPVAVEHFERAAAWMVGWYGLEVLLAGAHYRVMRGRTEEAQRIVEQVLAHPDYAPAVQYDVDLVLDSIRKKKEESELSHPRWRDTCARMARRAASAVGIKLH